jgi:pimeloyl-ACP methyl ester carboxylesterase
MIRRPNLASRLGRWLLGLTIAGLAIGGFLASAARAQEATGDWHGAIATAVGELRVVVKLRSGAGGLEGVVLAPDQSDDPIPLADVKLAGDRLSLAAPSVHGSYAGRWDAARQAWVGEWTQGAVMPLVLERGDLAKGPVVTGLDGRWEGLLGTAERGLHIVFRVRQGAYGAVALLDSPDQLVMGMPLKGLARDGAAVRFEQALIRGSYAGTLSADGQTLTGAWTQNGITQPLNFTRQAAETAALRRPQTPTPPFPYRAVEVAFDSAPGVRLAGTLTLPPGQGPFPAAVLITGSGAQDRDETLLGHKPFAVLADHLTRKGIAVLRYDDRGFAKSTGNFAQATSPDFATDAEAAVGFLRSRPEIDPARIGLIGHSEGGMIAPIAAVKDPKVAYVVLLAGPGVPSLDLMAAQRHAVFVARGANPAVAAKQEAVMAKLDRAVLQAPSPEAARAEARKVLGEALAAQGASPDAAAAQTELMGSKWYRYFIAYDPRPTLAKVRQPILALNGSKDVQVVASQNLPAIREATKGNKDVTVLELPGLNHLFQTAQTGAPGEYLRNEETFSPKALEIVSSWIVARTRR